MEAATYSLSITTRLRPGTRPIERLLVWLMTALVFCCLVRPERAARWYGFLVCRYLMQYRLDGGRWRRFTLGSERIAETLGITAE